VENTLLPNNFAFKVKRTNWWPVGLTDGEIIRKSETISLTWRSKENCQVIMVNKVL